MPGIKDDALEKLGVWSAKSDDRSKVQQRRQARERSALVRVGGASWKSLLEGSPKALKSRLRLDNTLDGRGATPAAVTMDGHRFSGGHAGERW